MDFRSVYVDMATGHSTGESPKINIKRKHDMHAQDLDISSQVSWTENERKAFGSAINISLFPRYTYYDEVEGLRHTHFQGYNTVQTFPMPDYSKMPLEPDHRRTLYWNPRVRTDKQGDAKVVFWNNASCRKLVISVEGILKDGTPALYVPARTN